MTIRDQIMDAKILRAHLIDMESMKPPCEEDCTDCLTCRARKLATAATLVLIIGAGVLTYRRIRRER